MAKETPSTPTLMYRIGGYGNAGIERVQVLKITPKTITVLDSFLGGPLRPERHSRNRHGVEYFLTFEEAKKALVNRCRQIVESAYEHVRRANKALDKARALTNSLPENL